MQIIMLSEFGVLPREVGKLDPDFRDELLEFVKAKGRYSKAEAAKAKAKAGKGSRNTDLNSKGGLAPGAAYKRKVNR